MIVSHCQKMIISMGSIVMILSVIFAIILATYGYIYTSSVIFITVVIFHEYLKEMETGNINTKNKFDRKDAIIITGCDSGLGFGLALHCHSLGAVVFAGVHNEQSEGAEELKQLKINILPIDITIQENINTFSNTIAKTIEEQNLNLRAVINNAGVMVFGEFEWQTEYQLNDQINVNLIGTMNVTKHLIPLIRKHQSRLIFVCSHCALEPLPGVAIYGATKAGLLAFATSLRVELRKYNIPVVSFIPGSFVTESNILARQKEHFQSMRKMMSEECNNFYGNYFDRYEEYLLSIPQHTGPVKLSNYNIFKVFEKCIFDVHPYATYKCEPWRYKIYHFLCKIMPTFIRDNLIEGFVNMPKWKVEN